MGTSQPPQRGDPSGSTSFQLPKLGGGIAGIGKKLNDSLFSLYEPVNPNAELVFFHGVIQKTCPDMHVRAWMSSNVCWPAVWLQDEADLPRARILSVQYDSSLEKANDAGVYSMNTLVEALASDLLVLSDVGQSGRPVVLVGHDLGGLVIKALCVYLATHISLYTGRRERREVPPWLDRIASRKWMTAGLGPLIEDPESSLRVSEASVRPAADSFTMVSESMETINKPDSRQSSSYQTFVSHVKHFMQAEVEEDSDLEFKDFMRNTVGLENVVRDLCPIARKVEGRISGLLEALSQPHGAITELQKSLLDCLGGNRSSAVRGPKLLQTKLKNCYKSFKRPILLFIDNIEDEEELEHIFPGPIHELLWQGSYIIMATRNSRLLSKLRVVGSVDVHLHEMKELDEASANELFCRYAFSSRKNVSDELKARHGAWKDVRKVLSACSRLPLALKVVGAALASEEGTAPSSRWNVDPVLERLTNWLSVDGKKEDQLVKSLEFSYSELDEETKEVFLDIVFCFQGSPWNEVWALYGDRLDMLKRRALIRKEIHIAPRDNMRFPVIRVHALLVALGEKKGRDLGTHVKLDLQKDDNMEDEDLSIKKGIVSVLVIRGTLGKFVSPSASVFNPSVRLTSFNTTEELHSVLRSDVRLMLRASHLKGTQLHIRRIKCFAPFLRILFLRDVLIRGTFASEDMPRNLQCFVSANSSVPFAGGDLSRLNKLIHVDIAIPTWIAEAEARDSASERLEVSVRGEKPETERAGTDVYFRPSFPDFDKSITKSYELPCGVGLSSNPELNCILIGGCPKLKVLPPGFEADQPTTDGNTQGFEVQDISASLRRFCPAKIPSNSEKVTEEVVAASQMPPLIEQSVPRTTSTYTPTHIQARDRIISGLENEQGPNVILLHGDPGSGKSVLARFIGESYTRSRGAGDPESIFLSVPRISPKLMVFLECGQPAVSTALLQKLHGKLHLQVHRSEDQCESRSMCTLPFLMMGMRIIVVLDDVWAPELIEAFLEEVRSWDGAHVKILMTSRRSDLSDDPEILKVKIGEITDTEAENILASHLGLTTIPQNLQKDARLLVERSGRHPLALAMVAHRITRDRSEDPQRWEAVAKCFFPLLRQQLRAALIRQGKQSMHFGSVLHCANKRSIGETLMLTYKDLEPDARYLLLLIGKSGASSLPSPVVQMLFAYGVANHHKNSQPELFRFALSDLENSGAMLRVSKRIIECDFPCEFRTSFQQLSYESLGLHDLQKEFLNVVMEVDNERLEKSLLPDTHCSVPLEHSGKMTSEELDRATAWILCILWLEQDLAERAAEKLGVSLPFFGSLSIPVLRYALEPLTWLMHEDVSEEMICAKQVILLYSCILRNLMNIMGSSTLRELYARGQAV
ncbi:hypothetical protein R1sor_003696 [Riccia sorocarpa]|uniref:AAA+ ATPase domain-containing protein n=1 Tax=Riccia sorocarpa TaxID=122646 RepID=A0ABD3H688_9MARC